MKQTPAMMLYLEIHQLTGYVVDTKIAGSAIAQDCPGSTH